MKIKWKKTFLNSLGMISILGLTSIIVSCSTSSSNDLNKEIKQIENLELNKEINDTYATDVTNEALGLVFKLPVSKNEKIDLKFEIINTNDVEGELNIRVIAFLKTNSEILESKEIIVKGFKTSNDPIIKKIQIVLDNISKIEIINNSINNILASEISDAKLANYLDLPASSDDEIELLYKKIGFNNTIGEISFNILASSKNDLNFKSSKIIRVSGFQTLKQKAKNEINNLNISISSLSYDNSLIDTSKSAWDYLEKSKFNLSMEEKSKLFSNINLVATKVKRDNLEDVSLNYYLEAKVNNEIFKSEEKILHINMSLTKGFLINPDLQQSKFSKLIEIQNLDRSQILNINTNLLTENNVDFLVGGYGENRNIYSDKNSTSRHLGLDLFLRPQEKVYAPFNGEIISYFYDPSSNSLASGIGASLTMRIKKEDYNLTGKRSWDNVFGENATHFYLAILHLDYRFMNKFSDGIVNDIALGSRIIPTMTSITNETPYKVKKGEQIGLVGEFSNNGGWAPHIHIEVHRGVGSKNNVIDENGDFVYKSDGSIKTQSTSGINDERVARYKKFTYDEVTKKWKGANPFTIRASGTFTNYKQAFILTENKFQIVDPNKVFGFDEYAINNEKVILNNPFP